jgi:hypothetical protein
VLANEQSSGFGVNPEEFRNDTLGNVLYRKTQGYFQLIVNYVRTTGANPGRSGQQIIELSRKSEIMDEELAKFPDLVRVGREMMNDGKNIEEILTALRAYSPSVIQSMKVMRDLLGIPMDEAKLLVHRSRTWSDMRDVFSEVHEIAENEYRNVSQEGPDGTIQARIDLGKKKKKND